MKRQKLIIPFVFLILSTSCIERYYTMGTSADFKPLLVVDGTITTDDSLQEIVISESTQPDEPKFQPLSGCDVHVEDDKGNNFLFNESTEAGHYHGIIKGSVLQIGSKYRLSVSTPDGKQYSSKYEELLPCPTIDSIYYELVSKPTTDPLVTENGAQFYLDFRGSENDTHYYRWKLNETYEYHSTWPVTRFIDENNNDITLPRADYSHFICYKTDEINDIFTLSTLGLTQNNYKKFVLNFVNDHTQRLMFKYSILVKQYSLTESAFNFWNNLRKNNKESANIFGKQPAHVIGNIYNVNDSAEVVLGYFGVSSVKTKRILVPGITDLSFDQVSFCHVTKPDGSLLPDERPLYWTQGVDENGDVFWGYSVPECFICTLLGGTTEKPSYWDTK